MLEKETFEEDLRAAAGDPWVPGEDFHRDLAAAEDSAAAAAAAASPVDAWLRLSKAAVRKKTKAELFDFLGATASLTDQEAAGGPAGHTKDELVTRVSVYLDFQRIARDLD